MRLGLGQICLVLYLQQMLKHGILSEPVNKPAGIRMWSLCTLCMRLDVEIEEASVP